MYLPEVVFGQEPHERPVLPAKDAAEQQQFDAGVVGHPYQHWLDAQADSAYAFDRNASNQYGLHWAGPFDTADIGRQDSATSLLVAVLP